MSQYGIRMDINGLVSGFSLPAGSFASGSLPQAQTILPAIEDRIRKQVHVQVELTRKGLEATIGAELKGLGLEPDDHGVWKFASQIAAAYEERLVARRINAIVDCLVSERPVAAKPE